MKEQILQVLQEIKDCLTQADPDWCVFGSAALVLNGIQDIKAHDIDILMSEEGTDRLEPLLKEYRIDRPVKTGSNFRSRHAHYIIKGMEVDISGSLEILKEGVWQPVVVKEKENCQGIRYATLADCIRLLQLFDRPKDREKLKLLSTFHF